MKLAARACVFIGDYARIDNQGLAPLICHIYVNTHVPVAVVNQDKANTFYLTNRTKFILKETLLFQKHEITLNHDEEIEVMGLGVLQFSFMDEKNQEPFSLVLYLPAFVQFYRRKAMFQKPTHVHPRNQLKTRALNS